MKQILIILIALFIVNCSRNKNSNAKSSIEFIEDTILERNNPKSIDLSKHQLFIDTTRNSIFYDKLKNWSESEYQIKDIEIYLNEINKDFTPKSINLKKFPSRFISLRNLNNKFILYDRCDGIDQRFVFRDTAFITYGPLESDAESISKIISKSDIKIELELKTFKAKSKDEKSFLKIEKINDIIYKMSYYNLSYKFTKYLTPYDSIKNFDMVVNHCPKMKMLEYSGFDK